MPPNNKLSAKQEQFCREYVVDFNATQAAIRAGYSKKTANSQAAGLMAKPSIQRRVAELNGDRNKAADFDAEWIRGEMKKLYEWSLNDPDRQGNPQLANKLLENMGKIEGQYVDRHEHRMPDVEIALSTGIKRKGK